VFSQAFNTHASIGSNHIIYDNYSTISTIELEVDKTKIGDGFNLEFVYDGLTVGDASYNDGGAITYNPSAFLFATTKIGEPGASPDASLSAINITGNTTNKSYNFDVGGSEVDNTIRETITLEHQDSLSGLTINPVFTKTTLSSSNY